MVADSELCRIFAPSNDVRNRQGLKITRRMKYPKPSWAIMYALPAIVSATQITFAQIGSLSQTLSKALKNIDSHSAIPTHLLSAHGSQVAGHGLKDSKHARFLRVHECVVGDAEVSNLSGVTGPRKVSSPWSLSFPTSSKARDRGHPRRG